MLILTGKILFRIINDVIGSQRFHQFQICSAAYPGNLGPKILRKLYRRSPYCSRGAIDKHFLALLNIPFSQKIYRCSSSKQNRTGFFIGHIVRFDLHQAILRKAGILGIGSKFHPGQCKHRIAYLKPLNFLAYGFNNPC
ncbi:hypothetical protein D3C85_1303440 [compost metagenome]